MSVAKWYIWILLLTLFLAITQYNSAQAHEIVEWIELPEPPNVQASIEVVQACKNGVSLGFFAENATARMDDGAEVMWHLSMEDLDGDGRLLVNKHPLWLSELEQPLFKNGRSFHFQQYFTILWGQPVTSDSVAMCLSGFCEAPLPLNECELDPTIQTTLVQTEQRSSSLSVDNELVLGVRSYDPAVGNNNGDGIQTVETVLIDPISGESLYTSAELSASSIVTVSSTLTDTVDGGFCAFGEDCSSWSFAEKSYLWPNGQPIRSGPYLIRVYVDAPPQRKTVFQTSINVQNEYVDETFWVNPVDGAVYVNVPAGSLQIGTPEEDTVHVKSKPVSRVRVSEFWIQRTETTNAQYALCVYADECTAPNNDEWSLKENMNYPVTDVSWEQANVYAKWVDGRLPTEAEWEKACRGTDGRPYPWGEQEPTTELSNFGGEIGESTPVGFYATGSSPYHLLDMGGNVWEWTSSLDSDYPYDAEDGREDPSTEGNRVTRGGSWFYSQFQLNCGARNSSATTSVSADKGFRVVIER